MDLTNDQWQKYSHSHLNGECVEVARNLPGVVALHDSKRPDSQVLVVSRAAFRALIRR